MSLEISIILILLISYLFSHFVRKMGLPRVIGLILAGMFITISPIRDILLFRHEEVILSFSNLGLYTLMFISGFEFSWNMLIKEERGTVAITISTVLTSLILGTVVFFLLGFKLETAIIMGICFGITAEATKARALIELKKLKTRLGTLLMSTGIINDLIGIILFLTVMSFFAEVFSFRELEILAAMMFSLFAGMFVHYKFNRLSREVRLTEKFLLHLIVPFFFLNMGISFTHGLKEFDFLIFLIVLATSTAGQMVGVFLIKPLVKLNLRQLYLLGWGMNSKGAVELAISFVALKTGLIPYGLYSSLVATVIITTFLFQIIITRAVRRTPEIME